MTDKTKLNEVDKVEITTLIDNYIDVVVMNGMWNSNDKS